MSVVNFVSPFGTFSSGGADVTPAAVNWADIAVSDPGLGIEENADQTISAIDATIQIKVTLSGDGLVGWKKNGVLVGGREFNSKTVAANSGDAFRVSISAIVDGFGTGAYVSGTATVTNESDGSAVLDTFNYAVQYIPDYS